jgi:hypothetical protein
VNGVADLVVFMSAFMAPISEMRETQERGPSLSRATAGSMTIRSRKVKQWRAFRERYYDTLSKLAFWPSAWPPHISVPSRIVAIA